MEIITSKANSVIKKTRKLHQKKHRVDSYLIEGWHLFEEAVAAGARMHRIFVTEKFASRVAHYPQAIQVTDEILKDLAESPSPQGIVVEVERTVNPLPKVLAGRFLVLEDVQDPGNVGTLIRTADAAGYSGVIVSEKTADSYNLKTLRSMQGSHFHLPIYRLPMQDFLIKVRQQGFPLIATSLSQTSIDYRTLPKLSDFALVVGNEGQGISQEVADQATYLAHITMPGQAESLNVAVAAGIVIFSLL